VHQVVACVRLLAARLHGALAGVFFREEEGAELVEYALLLGLIAVVCLGAIALLGEDISSLFSRLAAEVENVAPDDDASGANGGNGKGKGKGKGKGDDPELSHGGAPAWTAQAV
jgi:pilus assembly protein Flp/PilA